MDGCFLKGIQKGILLTCVGRDANNQMFPIAWAVVQVENRENWEWFIKHLIDDLEMEVGLNWTLITDKQKVTFNFVSLKKTITYIFVFQFFMFCRKCYKLDFFTC